MRSKPHNMPKYIPGPPPWPYPISEEVKQYVDAFWETWSEEISDTWYPRNEGITIEEDFKRTNYIELQIAGINQYNIQWGRGNLIIFVPQRFWVPSGDAGNVYIYFQTPYQQTLSPATAVINVRNTISPFDVVDDSLSNAAGQYIYGVHSGYAGYNAWEFRVFGYNAELNQGSKTRYYRMYAEPE